MYCVTKKVQGLLQLLPWKDNLQPLLPNLLLEYPRFRAHRNRFTLFHHSHSHYRLKCDCSSSSQYSILEKYKSMFTHSHPLFKITIGRRLVGQQQKPVLQKSPNIIATNMATSLTFVSLFIYSLLFAILHH